MDVAPALPGPARSALHDVLGPDGLVLDPDVVGAHSTDWTGRFRGRAPALLRPADTAEVAAVVAICRDHGLPLVPQGGNTGLVGGSVPLRGELVLSLRRLDTVGAVDTLAAQVTVGAGATLAAVQQAAGRHDLRLAVDLAARDSATVGGMVATNAGGLHVVRHGAMRRHVVGHEAVLGNAGIVRHLAGLTKDNTGYDLGQLLCGSEGTLAVLTAVRLALVPVDTHHVVALCGFEQVGDAVEAVGRWRRQLPDLNAAELMSDDGVKLVAARSGRSLPLAGDPRWYVLVEAAGRHDPTDELAELVGSAPGVGDVAVALDGPRRAELWALREEHTTAINTLGPPHKLDVTLPADRLAEFCGEVRSVVAALDPRAQVWLFGHLGDGNVHVNVTGVDPHDERVDDAVLNLVARHDGSISAEHGIGTAKRRWLHLSRSTAELSAFRAIRTALDPAGILNPNVLC
ncbi:FAD-binding oxidoreductase [Rhabdothermincola salaria]|uniref:FAD-binding oxidoreductase n=1 Tax=Rhabdothermincola salaria TaxID=2903142 RepID=UPI001E332F88|nr:FAD-binding oxidoreductase [Rhabdothermincola salaria]MCD9623020.1 FAD-binding oxidoreductase [Rhabdothermincola salaria]